MADGASLFLDEIGELPLSIQPKLLRVLQSGELQRVGADATAQVDVRVFAATNRDLRAEVAAGRFRADLLHRLDVCRVSLPALRDHPGDISLLAGHFCERARRSLGTGPVRLEPAAQRALEAYAWPGNVRELENVIARAILRASTHARPGATVVLDAGHLGEEFRQGGGSRPVVPSTVAALPLGHGVFPVTGRLRNSVNHYQRECIRHALDSNDGVWARAAGDLGMHRANFYRLAKRLGIGRLSD